MASVSNSSILKQQILVDLGAEAVWVPYLDDDTVSAFNERVAQCTGFSADQQELHAHYNKKWLWCCEEETELDDPNANFKNLLNDVSHISLKVFVRLGRSCNCQPPRDLF